MGVYMCVTDLCLFSFSLSLSAGPENKTEIVFLTVLPFC